MGWKGKLVSKAGHYLSQSLEFPLKQLQKYSSPTSVSDDHEHHEHQHAPDGDIEEKDGDDDYGPDTSSLTAFLLSLLSTSETRNARKSNIDALEDKASGSTSYSWHQHSDISDDEHVLNPQRSSDDDSIKSDPFLSFSQLGSPTTPIRLPPLSDKSVLLSEGFRAFLYSALPNIVKGRHWVLLYSTAKHGISLQTLYRRSSALSEPFLLVTGDFHGATFGGLLTAPLIPTSKKKYLGTTDMFVFTDVNGKPQIFRATGANRYFLLCMNDAISLGGGGHFALHLDEDLLNGSSGACHTFGNECLATSSDFSVSNVELWGFAHVSKYR